MTERDRFIQHTFAGGFSSDLGSDADTVRDNAGNIQVPFLIDADNIIYSLKGDPVKAPGTTRLNATALESGAAIKGIFDLWLTGTSGSPTQHRVIHVNTVIMKDDADGAFTNLFTGLEAGKVPDYTVFEDLLIIASNSTTDVPRSWDGSTAQNLAGTPPNFAFSEVHVNRLWAAGDASKPSRLYYSTSLNGADWTGKGSGFLDISPNDGDGITAIASHKGALVVFKGPYKGSIHLITGTSPANFSREDFAEGIGAVGHNTLFRFGDDLGFMWSDGSIRSLSATASFGDFSLGALSATIQTWIRENMNLTQAINFWAVNNDEFGHILFSIAIGSSATNNFTLMMDYNFKPARWALWPAYISASLASVTDASQSNRRIVMSGGQDGFVRKYNASANSIDGIGNVAYKVTTPSFNYGSPIELKTIVAASLSLIRKSDASITFGWARDENAQQTEVFSITGLNTLDTFILGTSTLGSTVIIDVFATLEEGGQFRSIQYQITASSLTDISIHGFGVLLSIGEGMSTE